MKKSIFIILSIALILSITLNVFLVYSLAKQKNIAFPFNYSIKDNIIGSNSSSFPKELVGKWTSDYNADVIVLSDGTVYWIGNSISVYKGTVEGYSFVLTKKYPENLIKLRVDQTIYDILYDLPADDYKDINMIYDLTLYGDAGFSAVNSIQGWRPVPFVRASDD